MGPGCYPKRRIPGYAHGTPWHPGGLAMVGEEGPEVLDLPRGTAVMPGDSPDFDWSDYGLQEEPRLPRYQAPQADSYQPQNFLEWMDILTGGQPIQARGSGAKGLFAGALALGANALLHKGGQRRRDTAQRNVERERAAKEQSDRDMQQYQERMADWRTRRARAQTATRGIPVIGKDGQVHYVTASSTLGQRQIVQGNIDPPPPKPKAPPKPKGPSGRTSSLALEAAKERLDAARRTFRAKYWQQKAGGDAARYSMLATSPLPPDAERMMATDPEVAAAEQEYSSQRIVTMANAAAADEDLAAIQALLQKSPVEVQEHPSVYQALEAAVKRIRGK